MAEMSCVALAFHMGEGGVRRRVEPNSREDPARLAFERRPFPRNRWPAQNDCGKSAARTLNLKSRCCITVFSFASISTVGPPISANPGAPLSGLPLLV